MEKLHTENGKIIEVTRFGEEPYLVKVDEVKGGHGELLILGLCKTLWNLIYIINLLIQH